eukprot:m.63929 g.63929  ORF g.63929 m.63929 type:complete len:172 (+) comp19506_c0_seq5:137-652(+)
MQEALKQAKNAMNQGEVPVGCVFVSNNKIVATGHNETNADKNATRHAELVAIDRIYNAMSKEEASQLLRTCTLYVTVEPCIMCASALCQVQIERVYYGCGNDRFGGCGSVLNVHEASTPFKLSCHKGLMHNEAIELLKQFYLQENPSAPVPKPKAARIAKAANNRQDGGGG